jgi:hypothetical protein
MTDRTFSDVLETSRLFSPVQDFIRWEAVRLGRMSQSFAERYIRQIRAYLTASGNLYPGQKEIYDEDAAEKGQDIWDAFQRWIDVYFSKGISHEVMLFLVNQGVVPTTSLVKDYLGKRCAGQPVGEKPPAEFARLTHRIETRYAVDLFRRPPVNYPTVDEVRDGGQGWEHFLRELGFEQKTITAYVNRIVRILCDFETDFPGQKVVTSETVRDVLSRMESKRGGGTITKPLDYWNCWAGPSGFLTWWHLQQYYLPVADLPAEADTLDALAEDFHRSLDEAFADKNEMPPAPPEVADLLRGVDLAPTAPPRAPVDPALAEVIAANAPEPVPPTKGTRGTAFTFVSSLPSKCVDAVALDPPYAIPFSHKGKVVGSATKTGATPEGNPIFTVKITEDADALRKAIRGEAQTLGLKMAYGGEDIPLAPFAVKDKTENPWKKAFRDFLREIGCDPLPADGSPEHAVDQACGFVNQMMEADRRAWQAAMNDVHLHLMGEQIPESVDWKDSVQMARVLSQRVDTIRVEADRRRMWQGVVWNLIEDFGDQNARSQELSITESEVRLRGILTEGWDAKRALTGLCRELGFNGSPHDEKLLAKTIEFITEKTKQLEPLQDIAASFVLVATEAGIHVKDPEHDHLRVREELVKRLRPANEESFKQEMLTLAKLIGFDLDQSGPMGSMRSMNAPNLRAAMARKFDSLKEQADNATAGSGWKEAMHRIASKVGLVSGEGAPLLPQHLIPTQVEEAIYLGLNRMFPATRAALAFLDTAEGLGISTTVPDALTGKSKPRDPVDMKLEFFNKFKNSGAPRSDWETAARDLALGFGMLFSGNWTPQDFVSKFQSHVRTMIGRGPGNPQAMLMDALREILKRMGDDSGMLDALTVPLAVDHIQRVQDSRVARQVAREMRVLGEKINPKAVRQLPETATVKDIVAALTTPQAPPVQSNVTNTAPTEMTVLSVPEITFTALFMRAMAARYVERMATTPPPLPNHVDAFFAALARMRAKSETLGE